MNGIIIVDKPANYTSRDVVNIIGKKFKTKKVGHTGTLDPIATGVLVICVNKATKIVELLTSLDKEYIAEFELGTLTDTLDNTGTLIKEEDTNIKKEEVLEVLGTMIGEQLQTVPLYSAVKINGKKLYEYARNNEEVELPKHNINIKELELLKVEQVNNRTVITVRAAVSKGTYIRTLGEDIANKLNTHSSMINLRRTKQGEFLIDDAIKLDDITGEEKLMSISKCLNAYKKVVADEVLEQDLLDGKIITNLYGDSEIFFVDLEGNPIALYKEYDKDTTKIKPWKMFKIR